MNITILVIDDDPDDRKFAEQALSKKDYRVLLCRDGRTGIETARREKPQLIILDCMLPGMSGVDTCKALKEDPDTEAIPILFLTGLDSPENIINCYECEPDNFLAKPLNTNELNAHVKQILDDRLI